MMDQDQEIYKVCPECAGEYRPEIERCADCGVPLVHPEEIAFRDARELPLRGGLVALRTAPIAWVRALAEDLAAQAIPYGIDRGAARTDGLLKLYVRRQDQAAAETVDEKRKRIEAPLYPEEEEIAEPESVAPLRFEAPTFKVCPRCGGEYRLEAERCVDCEVDLVFPGEAPAQVALADPAEEETGYSPLYLKDPLLSLPASDDLVCVCCRRARSLHFLLSHKLDMAGIAHRVDPAPYGSSLEVGCLYVNSADGDAAAAIDAQWYGGVPIEDCDPAELAVCPACGAPHPLGALECGSCGLGLGSDTEISDPICSRCGAVVGVATAHCPNCGAPLPRA